VLARREMVAVRPLAWLLDFTDQQRFSGYDPSDWELGVGFLRHDAPAVEVSALGDPRRTAIVVVRGREVLSTRPKSGGAAPRELARGAGYGDPGDRTRLVDAAANRRASLTRACRAP
jgi:hypothetical protein